jgi:hypothetical protein
VLRGVRRVLAGLFRRLAGFLCSSLVPESWAKTALPEAHIPTIRTAEMKLRMMTSSTFIGSKRRSMFG